MNEKWTLEEITNHIKINVEDYGAAPVVSALFKKLYGEHPKIGMSGFQGSAMDQIVEKLPDTSIEEAIKVLVNELRTGEDYRRSWQANIAMAFKDCDDKYDGGETIDAVANEAADNFLNLLCR